MKKNFAALFVLAALYTTGARAQAPLPIPLAGVMKDIPGAQELPDAKMDYKIVFDMRSMAESSEQVSPALERTAVLINTLRSRGVSPEHLHLVAVFHGKTILLLASDETYRMRTGVKSNPNLPLLEQLKNAGVTMEVCGQSALAQHYDSASLVPYAQMTLAATLTFINLETRGYIKVER